MSHRCKEGLTATRCATCGRLLCASCEEGSRTETDQDPLGSGAGYYCIDCYEQATGLTDGEEVNDDYDHGA